MKRLLLLIALFCGVSATLSAQSGKKPIENTHELRLGTYALTPYIWQHYDSMNQPGYSKEYDRSKFIGGDFVDIPAQALTYTYRTSKVMEFGAQLSYSGSFTPYYSIYTGEHSHTDSWQYVTLTVVVVADDAAEGEEQDSDRHIDAATAAYFVVQGHLGELYAVGFTAEFHGKEQRGMFGAVQFTPVGITVGRELFGYGEILTIGSNGFATLGIGYRF